MVSSYKSNKLIAGMLISGLVSMLGFAAIAAIAAIASEPHHAKVPTATVEEAKIKHWRVPEIERTFWDISELENAYIAATPAHLNDGIPVGKLGVDGGNKAMVMKLAEEIADKKHAEVDSMLIAHKGKVLFESYYSRGRIDLSHPQSSTTKSYTALALGRAIQLGYLSMSDLDKPIVSFLEGLDSAKFAKGAENITLHQVLTMSSGLQISSEKIDQYRKNPEMYRGIKQVQAFLEDSGPVDSQMFNYQGANPDMVMQVLDTVVPDTAEEFIRNELFGKMGIVNYDWRNEPGGLPAAGAFSSMTSRNMLKVGTLVMNKGKWNGKQLIPESFISKATNRNVRLSAEQVQNFYSGDKLSNSGYGYFWWQADMKVGDKSYLSNSAQGGGGVTVLFVEELELLVVITAHSRQAYLQMIAERVLPAFIK